MTRAYWLILIALLAAVIVAVLETFMIIAALGTWLTVIGDAISVGWLMTSYLLVSSASAVLCGRIGDLVGRKRVMTGIMVLAAIGSAMSAFGPTIEWTIAGRAIQGIAGGGTVPLCFGMVREYLPAQKVPVATGVIIGVASGGSALGLLLGGIVTDLYGPYAIFVVSGAAAIVAVPIIAFALPRSNAVLERTSFDLLGGMLFAPAVMLMLLAISNFNNPRWDATALAVLFAGGAGLLAYWVLHELRQSDPMIEVRLLASRNGALANLTVGCVALAGMQLMPVASLLLQQPEWTGVGFGQPATLIGIIKIPSSIAGMLAAVCAGWLASMYDGRTPMILGTTLLASALLLGLFGYDSILMLSLALIVASAGTTTTMTGVTNAVIAAAPPARTSEATGMIAAGAHLFQSIGMQVIAVILTTSTVQENLARSYPTDIAYTRVFLFMIAAAFVGFLFSLAMRRTAPSETVTL